MYNRVAVKMFYSKKECDQVLIKIFNMDPQ